MPTRMLRDGILSSDRVNLLTAPEEVFYRRLMSVVDDYGRFIAHAKLIRAACFPLKLESVSDSDIGKWLLATEKAGLVRVYPASDGKRKPGGDARALRLPRQPRSLPSKLLINL